MTSSGKVKSSLTAISIEETEKSKTARWEEKNCSMAPWDLKELWIRRREWLQESKQSGWGL